MLCDVAEGVEAEIWQQPPLQSPLCSSFPSHCLGSFFGVSDRLFGAAEVDLFCFFLLCHWPEQNTQTWVSLAVAGIQLLLDGVARSRCFFLL